MIITVTDFERVTGLSRHTVYAWIYRDKLPDGIKIHKTIGKTKVLNVSKASKFYKQISEFKEIHAQAE